jgi:hypothetical protein
MSWVGGTVVRVQCTAVWHQQASSMSSFAPVQEMHAEFESMRAYMLSAKEQASEWLKRQVEVTDTLRSFVQNLDGLMSAHGIRLRLNTQRHHSTVWATLYVYSAAEISSVPLHCGLHHLQSVCRRAGCVVPKNESQYHAT